MNFGKNVVKIIVKNIISIMREAYPRYLSLANANREDVTDKLRLRCIICQQLIRNGRTQCNALQPWSKYEQNIIHFKGLRSPAGEERLLHPELHPPLL